MKHHRKLVKTLSIFCGVALIVSTLCVPAYSQRGWGRNGGGSSYGNSSSQTQIGTVGVGGYSMIINPKYAPMPGETFTKENVLETLTVEQYEELYSPKSEENKSDTQTPAEDKKEATDGNNSEDSLMKVPQESYKLGYPQADQIVKTMESEILSQIAVRPGVQQRYYTWLGYLKARTASSARVSGFGGYNGLCRLKWYEELLLDPVHSTSKTEEFSRVLHAGIIYGNTKGYGFMLQAAREKMGVAAGTICETKTVNSAEEAYKLLAARLGDVKGLHAKALASITPEWLKVMNGNLYGMFTVQAGVGHTVNNHSETIRQILLNFAKIDYAAYYDAAGIMFSFAETNMLDQLLKLDEQTIEKLKLVEKDKDGNPIEQKTISGVTGDILMVMDSPAGKILVGGKGDNVYYLENLQGYCAVIDLGGNDTYHDGMVTMNRPVLLIIDEEGNDTYTGQTPAIQGSSILGISCLIDRKGDDLYSAQHLAQGSTLAGVGIQLDMAGNDTYRGVRRVQGTALAGIGVSIDLGGDDTYRAAMWAQGLGHPLGFGLLDNVAGNDTYFLGGSYPDSYPETPGYEGWGQGLGSGIRDLAGGGIGVLLEGGGNDLYEYDYIAHGGGYWQGVGILRDFSGHDNHAGATSKAFLGGPRHEQRFQRLGNGFGCHYAVGYLFDDFGDDIYNSTIMNNGFGWDAAFGVLVDFQGNDKYTSVGGGSDGNGAQASMGVLFDYGGVDTYYGSTQGYADPNINPDYHSYPACGGNFSFLIDYAGMDTYGCRLKNNGFYQRGSTSGYIIDRPINPQKTIPVPKDKEN